MRNLYEAHLLKPGRVRKEKGISGADSFFTFIAVSKIAASELMMLVLMLFVHFNELFLAD